MLSMAALALMAPMALQMLWWMQKVLRQDKPCVALVLQAASYRCMPCNVVWKSVISCTSGCLRAHLGEPLLLLRMGHRRVAVSCQAAATYRDCQ